MSEPKDGLDPQTNPESPGQSDAGNGNPQNVSAGADRQGVAAKDSHATDSSASGDQRAARAAQAAYQDIGAQPIEGLGADQDLAALLAEAQEQIAQYHDRLLRAQAEVENIRRRSQEEVAKARKFGTESFAESLIPVRDSLEAALNLENQSPQDWQKGVETTLRQLNTAFERNQMREIAPEPGDGFDPHRHQAISSVPSELPSGTIAQVLQKGFLIADRVLRPALVMVSSGVSQEPGGQS